MFDLENINTAELIEKYSKLLVATDDEKKKSELAYVMNISVNYLMEKYWGLPKDRKTWIIVMIRNLYDVNKLKINSDITEAIDNFVEYHNLNYDKFIEESVGGDDYDKNENFMHQFIIENNVQPVTIEENE